MRISRHQFFMEIARTCSKRSTCHRLNVGAVLVIDNHLVSTGYNGPDSGEPHCHGNKCAKNLVGGCARSIHAEENAIRFAPDGIIFENKDNQNIKLYVTHSPCVNCALKIYDNYINEVFYETAYKDTSSLDWLVNRGVKVFRYSPSGYLVDHKTNEIIEHA